MPPDFLCNGLVSFTIHPDLKTESLRWQQLTETVKEFGKSAASSHAVSNTDLAN